MWAKQRSPALGREAFARGARVWGAGGRRWAQASVMGLSARSRHCRWRGCAGRGGPEQSRGELPALGLLPRPWAPLLCPGGLSAVWTALCFLSCCCLWPTACELGLLHEGCVQIVFWGQLPSWPVGAGGRAAGPGVLSHREGAFEGERELVRDVVLAPGWRASPERFADTRAQGPQGGARPALVLGRGCSGVGRGTSWPVASWAVRIHGPCIAFYWDLACEEKGPSSCCTRGREAGAGRSLCNTPVGRRAVGNAR